MPAVATRRAKTDSKVRRSGCSERNPPVTGVSPVGESCEPPSTLSTLPGVRLIPVGLGCFRSDTPPRSSRGVWQRAFGRHAPFFGYRPGLVNSLLPVSPIVSSAHVLPSALKRRDDREMDKPAKPPSDDWFATRRRQGDVVQMTETIHDIKVGLLGREPSNAQGPPSIERSHPGQPRSSTGCRLLGPSPRRSVRCTNSTRWRRVESGRPHDRGRRHDPSPPRWRSASSKCSGPYRGYRSPWQRPPTPIPGRGWTRPPCSSSNSRRRSRRPHHNRSRTPRRSPSRNRSPPRAKPDVHRLRSARVPFVSGIEVTDGTIRLSFRLWSRGRVKVRWRFIGVFFVTIEIELLQFSSITDEDLARTGEPDLETLRRRAAHAGPDPQRHRGLPRGVPCRGPAGQHGWLTQIAGLRTHTARRSLWDGRSHQSRASETRAAARGAVVPMQLLDSPLGGGASKPAFG